MKASDLVWSPDEKKRGRICSRMIHTDMKSLRESDFIDPERENMARVRLFGWLRQADQVFSENNPNELLPSGFLDSDVHVESGLPSRLFQTGYFFKQVFAILNYSINLAFKYLRKTYVSA